MILVTGRHFMTARPYHHELQLSTPIVCGNGAYLYDPHNNAITSGDPLPSALLSDLFAELRRHEVRALMHLEQGIVYRITSYNVCYTKLLRSGLIGRNGPDSNPKGRPTYQADATDYQLADGQNELVVPMSVTDEQGVTYRNNFV